MISGSTRYARHLGFFGGLGATAAEGERNTLEKFTGIDLTGSLKASGGTGWTVGAAPTTILMMLIGAAAGVSMMDKHDGGSASFVGPAFKGALGGVLIATGMRAAGNLGI